MKLSGLGPRPVLRVVLYLVSALGLGLYLWSAPGEEALTIVVLFALWVYLGIPACCGMKR